MLNDPIAQQLLNSSIPGHLAYVWPDGTPRVIPIGFTWTGKELVTSSPAKSPKACALKEGDSVAITFDTYTPPFKVLYIRGIVHIESSDGIVPEWHQAGERLMGIEGMQGFMSVVDPLLKAGVLTMVRITVTPTWAGIIDFQTRFPSGIEIAMEELAMMGSVT
jgi:hypothetical protein